MENNNLKNLIIQAQLGSDESMTELAKLAENKVLAYIYRLTMDKELAQDLTQETLLEMVKSIKKLQIEHPNAFWAWLFRTAMGKTQHHYRTQHREKSIKQALINKQKTSFPGLKNDNDGPAKALQKELAGAVFEAMKQLKLAYRNILILRCFEQLSYAQIATMTDSSELQSRVLFYRAKQSLKKRLAHRGFSKGLFLIALGLFAQVTSPEKATASSITVSSTAAKVGPAATIIGALTTKLGLSLITAAAIAVIAVPNIKITDASKWHNADKAGFIARKVQKRFQYPSSFIALYNADSEGWEGMDASGDYPHSVNPDQWVTGLGKSGLYAVTLVHNSWVELKFPGTITDGYGDDIIISEIGSCSEKAEILLTDGAENQYSLGILKAKGTNVSGPCQYGIDIDNISLPFKASAIRIISLTDKGGMPGFDLHSVKARITPD
ncbi:RNA polymerase sigma factor [Planctomycetota bacterium]